MGRNYLQTLPLWRFKALCSWEPEFIELDVFGSEYVRLFAPLDRHAAHSVRIVGRVPNPLYVPPPPPKTRPRKVEAPPPPQGPKCIRRSSHQGRPPNTSASPQAR